jgi:transcriptional regulator with XRE-family HTH domain
VPRPTAEICRRFGIRLRRLREARNWGQADLAAISGLSRELISRLENGRVDLRLTTLQTLAGSFRITISQLMRGL